MKQLTKSQQKRIDNIRKNKKLKIPVPVFPDKICKGCGLPFKITCKASLTTKLYCKDSCKPRK